MCTVTFIPAGGKYLITSSRDEQAERPTAIFPKEYEYKGQRLLYPQDPKASGSWIAVHESGNAAVLLNGAMQAHLPEPPYRKSRGLILLDLIANLSPADAFEQSDFSGIEPFTVILLDDHKLYSGKWDGRMKWTESLNISKPHIWSSVTLYNPAAIRKRENWFEHWVNENPYPGTLDIMHFHQKGGEGDPFNDILMNREKKLFTNSISSIRLGSETCAFRYLDLRSGESSDHLMTLKQTITANP